MPIVFSYGSLQEPRVQVSTFGRLLAGTPDELIGFEHASVAITDPARAVTLGRANHANVIRSQNRDRRVSGIAFELTDAELVVADSYEREDGYQRISVVLASGRAAFVYVHGGSC